MYGTHRRRGDFFSRSSLVTSSVDNLCYFQIITSDTSSAASMKEFGQPHICCIGESAVGKTCHISSQLIPAFVSAVGDDMNQNIETLGIVYGSQKHDYIKISNILLPHQIRLVINNYQNFYR